MNTYDACAIIECFAGRSADHEAVIAAYQSLIDSGVVWQLQGFYGRTAAALIESGDCQRRIRPVSA
jgi:hypothetical protein